jgi:hypothetical protein
MVVLAVCGSVLITSAQGASSDNRAHFCIYNYITQNKNTFFTLAVPRIFASARSARDGDCAKVFGLNLMFSYPAMTKVTSEQLSCRGDCGGLMRLMIENQKGSKATLSDRVYHVTLLNDGTLTRRNELGNAVEKLEQENDSEIYIQKPRHSGEKRWMIQKGDNGEIVSAIECSISTPGKLCIAYFHLLERPEVSLQLSFLMERLADWPNIRKKTEQFVTQMLN